MRTKQKIMQTRSKVILSAYIVFTLFTISCSGKDVNQTNVNETNQSIENRIATSQVSSVPTNVMPVELFLFSPAEQAFAHKNIKPLSIKIDDIFANLNRNNISSESYFVQERSIDSSYIEPLQIIFSEKYYKEKKSSVLFLSNNKMKKLSSISFSFHYKKIPDEKDMRIMKSLIETIPLSKEKNNQILEKLIQLQTRKTNNQQYDFFNGLITTTLSENNYLIEINSIPKTGNAYFYIYKTNNEPKKFND